MQSFNTALSHPRHMRKSSKVRALCRNHWLVVTAVIAILTNIKNETISH